MVSVQKERKRYDVETGNDPTGKTRREHYDKLFENIETVRRSFRMLRSDLHLMEPMGLAECELDNDEQIWVDWTSVEQGLAGATKFLDDLENWIALARDEAKKAVVSNRPVSPMTRTLDRLAFSLGLIYANQRGKLPGLNMGMRGTRSSPFEKFMTAVAEAMNLAISGDEIKRSIRRLNVKSNRWFHESLNDPPRDTSRTAAETFGKYIDKMVH